MFWGTKNIEKTPKIICKFQETDWSMNNRNKVFAAHEKDFRALYYVALARKNWEWIPEKAGKILRKDLVDV
jgi:hypothetical protein